MCPNRRRCAGCVGAAANGIGVVGAAPGATLVAIRVGDASPDPFFYPAATVCAFMHAADVGLDVTSNSCASRLSCFASASHSALAAADHGPSTL